MKRFLIFTFLGPLIGFVTFMTLVQVLNVALGGSMTLQATNIVLLPLGYALGIIPALLTAWFDHAVRNVRHHVLWTALFAYFAGFMPILTSLLMGLIGSGYVLVVGLVGLVPGAICSWLSSESGTARRVRPGPPSGNHGAD